MSFEFIDDVSGLNSIASDAWSKQQPGEPEIIVIKEEDETDIDESFLEDLLVHKKPRKRSSPITPFCTLCLRKCPPGLVVKFCSEEDHTAVDVTEAEQKLDQALGMRIELQYRAMCPTCWKLVQLITDFKECSAKATSKLTALLKGLNYDQRSDKWMSESTLNAIDLNRKMIRNHLEQIDVVESHADKSAVRKTARQNRKRKENKPTKVEKVEVIPDIALDDFKDNEDVPNSVKEEPNNESFKPTTSNAEPAQLQKDHYKVTISTCKTCGRNFDGKHALLVHKQHCNPDSPSKEKYFSCPICTVTFIENSGLTFHLNKHKGIRPFKCRKFCNNTFFSNYTRIKHERKYCEKEGRICDICGSHLKNEASLLKHTESVHGEAKHGCEICGRMFKSAKNHRMHKRVHSEERKYPCTTCGKAFKAPHSLKIHKRIHTQEMPFACHLCEHAFNYKVSLKNHIERHHGSNNLDYQ